MKIELDTNALSAAIRAYAGATKKDLADVVNRAGRAVILGGKGVRGAVQLTKKASAAAISEALKKDGLAFQILNSPRARKPKKLSGWTSKGKTRAEINEAARQLIAARRSSAAYIVAGWLKAAAGFGFTTRKRVSGKGLAAKSYATKATPGRLVATLANLARGADIVGRGALQQAVNNAAADMMAYAERKMSQTASKA